MNIFRITLLVATTLLWSCSDPSGGQSVKDLDPPKPPTDPDDHKMEKVCIPQDIDSFTGEWTIYDTGSIHADHMMFNGMLDILKTSSSQNELMMQADVQLSQNVGGLNPLTAVCVKGYYHLEGDFDAAGCGHDVTINLLNSPPDLNLLNCNSMTDPSENQTCNDMKTNGFSKHIKIEFDHNGNCPGKVQHAGVAHAGGTGGSN